MLSEDGERSCHLIHGAGNGGAKRDIVAVIPAREVPSSEAINRFVHEYGLKDCRDSAWAVRPLQLVRERDLTLLVIVHPKVADAYSRPSQSIDRETLKAGSDAPYRGCCGCENVGNERAPN